MYLQTNRIKFNSITLKLCCTNNDNFVIIALIVVPMLLWFGGMVSGSLEQGQKLKV